MAPVGAEVPAPVEVCGRQEKLRVEVAAEEELARVVEGQEAEAEKVVAAAKPAAMGVLAEGRVEGPGGTGARVAELAVAWRTGSGGGPAG